MSEIRANTVSNAAGTGPVTLTGQSAAKAMVSFNGQGTVAVLDSFNFSSLTDDGGGAYTLGWTSVFDAANYYFAGSGRANAGGFMVSVPSAGTIAVGSLSIWTTRSDNGLYDMDYVTVTVHGDLA